MSELRALCEATLHSESPACYLQLYNLLFDSTRQAEVEADNTLFALQSVARIWKMESDFGVSEIFWTVQDVAGAVRKYQKIKFLARRMEQGMESQLVLPLFRELLASGLSAQALYYIIKKEVRKSMQTMLLGAGYLKQLGEVEKSETLISFVAQTEFAEYEKEPIALTDGKQRIYEEMCALPTMVTFVVCTNDEDFMRECELYLSRLYVPNQCQIDLLSIAEASSMTEGYNAGYKASEGAIHVYLHQDVFILNRYFIYDILQIFTDNPQVGMIGMVGSKVLPEDATMWHGMRVGAIYSASDVDTSQVENRLEPVGGDALYEEVEVLDGMLLVSCCEIPFREELFDGWDFYDLSACMEHRRAGFKIVVPRQNKPWCIHDCGRANLSRYETYRELFLKEYGDEMLSHK